MEHGYAKIACGGVNEEIGTYLRPKQIGFNTRGGCNTYMSFICVKKPKKTLKIDFKNAFNSCGNAILQRHAYSSVMSRSNQKLVLNKANRVVQWHFNYAFNQLSKC